MNATEQTLFEPSEADLVQQAMRQPLERKIENAIGLLKLYEQQALQLSPDGYWLAYSGGKDSDVILELAKMAGVKYRAVYNVTTIDPPELVRYVKREHPEVEFNRGCGVSMLTMLWKNSSCLAPPTRTSRWCCKLYKEHGGENTFKIIGVRAAESVRRGKTWNTVVQCRKGTKTVYMCPIVYWTDKDVWNFHKLSSIQHCSLYDEGFKRLGCIGCPLSTAAGQRKSFKRWPEYERLWKSSFKLFWTKWHGVPKENGDPRWFESFNGPEEMWQWWISGKARKGKQQCQFDFLYT